MPRRSNYWKHYYRRNKDKYKQYHCPQYAYKLTVNNDTYIFDKKQDIHVERINYRDIVNNPQWKLMFEVQSCKQKQDKDNNIFVI